MTLAVAMVTVSANAQNPISGQTRNADTGEALPYVTVAIKGRGIGTISDREGRFEINGSKEGFSPADSIVFFVKLSNDAYAADFGYSKLRISGLRYTGFESDN